MSENSSLVALGHQLADEVDEIAQHAARRIIAVVPAYANTGQRHLQEDVARHCRTVFQVLVSCLQEERDPRESDFPFTNAVAMNRVLQGISLPDFLRGFRIGQITFWQRLVKTMPSVPSTEADVVRVVEVLMEVIELGSSAAAAAYLEAEQFRVADRDRLRRDVVEDLIDGRPPMIGPRQDLLSGAGLSDQGRFLVAVLRPKVTEEEGLGALRRRFRAALGPEVRGLLVAHHDEMIGLFPVDSRSPDGTRVVQRLRAAEQDIRRQGVELIIGVSTVHRHWAEAPDAYREAVVVTTGTRRRGVVALSEITPLQYLGLGQDRTPRRLIDPRIVAFVEEEKDRESSYLETLEV